MARDDAYHVIRKGEQECPSDILLKAISQTKKKNHSFCTKLIQPQMSG